MAAEPSRVDAYAQEVHRLHTESAGLAKLIEEHRVRLIACLKAIYPNGKDPKDRSLKQLMEEAQAVLEEMNKRQNSLDRLEQDIAKTERHLPILVQDAKDAKQEFSQWQERWATLMAKLGLPDDATSAQAHAYLTTLNQMFEQRNSRDKEAIRVRDMGNFNSQFEERVREVVQSLEWDAGDLSPTQLVNQLHAELTNAKEADNKRRGLQTECETKKEALEEILREIQKHEMQLAEMCKQAGCKDPDELPEAEKKSDDRLKLEQVQTETREDILRFAGDAAFEEFLKEADGEDTDALAGQLSDLDRQIEEVEQKLTGQIELVEREKNQLDFKSGGSDAALAAEEKQALLAEISQHLERYIQLRLASDVLREGAERYRKKHQGPVLKRASELFKKLTCGSFLRLQNDGDDQGKPRLVGVRMHNDIEESIELKGMSDGTADQLYLALRIASLEDWLDHHPPMPLIVDDVLINFDDQRAIAALLVLADLSRRTQVIFFTHHRHLVDLAEIHLPADVLYRHDLGPQKPGRKKKAPPAKKDESKALF